MALQIDYQIITAIFSGTPPRSRKDNRRDGQIPYLYTIAAGITDPTSAQASSVGTYLQPPLHSTPRAARPRAKARE